jgi:membrane protein required for beta-lactamase induction
MTLITLLLVLLLEYYLGSLEPLRAMGLLAYARRQLKKLSRSLPLIDGMLGLFLLGLLPAVLIWFLQQYLDSQSSIASFLLGFILLAYSIGPKDLGAQLQAYLTAMHRDQEEAGRLAAEFIQEDAVLDPDTATHEVAGACLVAANDRVFAVIFWFVLLGPAGCLCYRLVSQLRHQPEAELVNLSEYVRSLYDLINWAPARVTALTYALAGSLTHSLEAWQFRDSVAVHHNEAVLKHAGLGSLQLSEASDSSSVERLVMVHSLIKRSLMILLVTLALMTLSGHLN